MDKAQGVFLWVHLVVKNLITFLNKRKLGNIKELQKMVNDLPTEIEALYTHIWNAINADNMETATRLLRLWEASFHGLEALTIWVAGGSEIPRQADGTVSDTTVEHITRCVQGTLDIHTRGILQVSPTGVANILHRSAADWLEKASIWNDICSKHLKTSIPILRFSKLVWFGWATKYE